MFRLGIVLLSLLSVNAYAQDNKPAKHYQFGMEVQQYTVGSSDKGLKQYIDSNEFIDNYKEIIKSSKAYQYLMTLLVTSPDVYQASLSTIQLNESYHANQQMEELLKTQKRTNELLEAFFNSIDLSKMNINSDGTGGRLMDTLSYTKH